MGKIGVNKKRTRLFVIKSIRSKLLLSYLIAIAIPVFTLGVYSMRLLDQTLKEHSLSAEKGDLSQLVENIKYYLNSCIDLSDNICFDNNIWEYFYHKYSYPILSIEGYYNLIRPVFTRYLALKKEVLKITVFTNNDTLLFNNFEIAPIPAGSYEESLYEETLNTHKILWKLQLDEQKKQRTILMSRMLNLNNVNVGMLVIYLNEEHLYNALKGQMDGSNTYLVTPDHIILSSTDREAIGRDITYFNCDLQIEDKNITVREINTSEDVIRLTGLSFTLQGTQEEQWKIIKTVPIKSVLFVTFKTKAYQVCGFLLLLLLLVLISLMLSNGITKRIKELVEKMKKVEQGDFHVSVKFSGQDEISYLGNAFDTMVEKLDNLVKQVYEMQLAQKDLELKNRETRLNMLQSQINPHFLFNTLDAVLYGIKNKKRETGKIVELLANNFRRSIQWEEDLIPVEEEMEFIKEYLTIQKFRMQDKLEWYADISPDALKYKMPKMITQPLIENAVYHGLSLKKGKGNLYLSVYASQEHLVVVVRDDGVGIEEWRLEEIHQILQSRDIKAIEGHIGIKNVYDRIRLYYGDRGSLTIKSEYHSGTTVKICLPL